MDILHILHQNLSENNTISTAYNILNKVDAPPQETRIKKAYSKPPSHFSEQNGGSQSQPPTPN